MTTEDINLAPATGAPEGAAPTAAPTVPDVAPTPAAPAAPTIEAPAVQTFEATGDPGLDLALDFIGKLGIGPDDDALAAAQSGDFTKITERLKGMGERAAGFEKYLALAKSSYEATTAKVAEQAAALESLVHGAVGGKEKWAAIKTWASANATDAERAQINKAFETGGFAARAAAERLAALYQRSGQAGHKSAAKPDAGAGADTSAGALTAKQYQAELQALQQGARGRDVSQTPAYKALQDRRLAGRRAGI
jgi:hypothetical protein